MVKVLSPFGPKIAKLKFSKQLIKKINNEVDKICSNKLLANRLDYSKKLVGQVKQEISLPKSLIIWCTSDLIFEIGESNLAGS